MVDAHRTFVIVGGGLAGAKAAETLRAEGFTGRVILIGDERDHPYERPPLSKAYLTGKDERDSVFVHEPAWYARADIELHLGQTVVSIDRESRSVRLGDGTVVHYDKLLLATGAEPRRLEIPGTGLAGVHHLRRLPHADRLRHVLAALGRDNGHLIIAGAGWIGLEVAAAARGYGAEVTVVEPAPTPLYQVVGPELGQVFAELHRERGVRFHFGVRLTEIIGQDGMVLAARTGRRRGAPGARDPRRDRRGLASPFFSYAAVFDFGDRAEGGGIAVNEKPAHLRSRHLRRGRRRRRPAPAARDAAARGALGERTERRPRRRPRHARPGRDLRPGPLLLLGPVRPRHGVLGLGPARLVRPGRAPRRRREAGVHRLLAQGPQGARRDERQCVGRHRTDPAADPDPGGGGRADARRSRCGAHRPREPLRLTGVSPRHRRIHAWQAGSTMTT
ncbi:ferredoxin reductase [Streptomyces pristinaespiralis ATCC 25486]|uniref:Ferredoxin reductase n=1 Tax=Streptomyces pristinaespiralis (strain ATCC 25486 / DSM 40338 / CBS 914.69 / JCM 4507 / KCC S-0507 / NBRC 13074 / NRRL 2958 / 5647) TaxID=457429 RepID=D6X7F5_STRE2|nr:ferredoxin reductase [Streptomyces pristinaespiralis ATCC 25486]